MDPAEWLELIQESDGKLVITAVSPSGLRYDIAAVQAGNEWIYPVKERRRFDADTWERDTVEGIIRQSTVSTIPRTRSGFA